MWYPKGFEPESSPRFRSAGLALAALAVLGAAGCGPGGGAPATYSIAIALSAAPHNLNTLDFDVAYTGGDVVGTGAAASCTLVAHSNSETATYNDDDTSSVLTASIDAHTKPLVVGNKIVTCNFTATTQPTSANFTFTITAAQDSITGVAVPVLTDVVLVVTSTEVAPAAETADLGEVTE